MKKILLLALFTGLTLPPLFAQRLNDSLLNLNNEELANYYLKKSRSQKTAAYVMAAGGVTLGIAGASISMSQWEFNPFSDSQPSYSSTGDVIAIIGALVAVGSIPVFMAAAKNKKRAKLLLGGEPMAITPSFHLQQTSIGLAIPLGK
jgi:hypothetical protein